MLVICNLIGWKIVHILHIAIDIIETQITRKLSSKVTESVTTIISSDTFNNIENTK